MYIKFEKIRENVFGLEKSNYSDAGIDIKYSPKDETREVIYVKPGESVVLETGIKVEVPHGYVLKVENRGSMSAKKHLLVGAGVIDAGYSGEIFINLHNTSNDKSILIGAGDKIAQLVLYPIVHAFLIEGKVYENEVYISSRGEGKLGSTGK